MVRSMSAARTFASVSAAVPGKRPRGRPRKTLDERDDGNRRHALLAKAAQLFRRKGFAATTTRDIAAAAGMQSGSPFYHFKTKSELLFAIMEEGMGKALALQRSLLEQPGFEAMPPAEQLRQRIRVHFDVLLGPGSDFVPVMLYEQRSLTPRQRKVLASLVSDYESLWLPVLEALHREGRLCAPVGLAKLLILGALNWSVQWFDAKKGASVQQLTDAAVSMFLKEL